MPEPTPSRRSWRRFSLRSYLVFITLMACFFGWVTNERRQSEFERKTGKTLGEQDVAVSYIGSYDSREPARSRKPQGWWRDLARNVLGERIGTLLYDRLPVDGLTPLTELKNFKFPTLCPSGASGQIKRAVTKNCTSPGIANKGRE